jgi:hypothetical protein
MAHTTFYSVGTGAHFPDIGRTEREAERLPLFSAAPKSCCNFILPPEAQAALLSRIYSLWTDCRGDSAFGIAGCLAIT